MATKQATKQVKGREPKHGIGSAEPRGFARLTPEERHRAAQIGGLYRAATMDKVALTAASRRGQWESWRRKADPDGKLSEAERQRRAEALQKAHMIELTQARLAKQAARKAAKAKSQRKAS